MQETTGLSKYPFRTITDQVKGEPVKRTPPPPRADQKKNDRTYQANGTSLRRHVWVPHLSKKNKDIFQRSDGWMNRTKAKTRAEAEAEGRHV